MKTLDGLDAVLDLVINMKSGEAVELHFSHVWALAARIYRKLRDEKIREQYTVNPDPKKKTIMVSKCAGKVEKYRVKIKVRPVITGNRLVRE